MLGWLLDEDDAERAKAGDRITEEFVKVKPDRVNNVIIDDQIDYRELKKYLDDDAWSLVEHVIQAVETNQHFRRKIKNCCVALRGWV